MKAKNFWLGASAIALLAFMTMGCVHPHHARRDRPRVVQAHKPGPPPHAPAHGYRHKHHAHGVDLVFDSGLGVYLVVGLADHFFLHDQFYRRSGGEWFVSAELGHGWTAVGSSVLPKGLGKAKRAKKHKQAHKKHGKKHAPPAKHGY